MTEHLLARLDDLTGLPATAANVGSAGTGVFKQLSGTELQFYKINPASTKVSFTLIGSDRIDVDVVEANLNIGNQAGNLVHTRINPVTSDRLLGRDTAGAGAAEEIAVGGGVEFTGAPGIQRSALTGDVTASAGSGATTIANDAVSNAKLADMAQATIKGRQAGAGTGDPEDLTAAQGRTALGLGTAATQNTGTSGNTLPFLDGTNTWSAQQTFQRNAAISLMILDRSDTHGDNVIVGETRYTGRDSAAATETYARVNVRAVLDNAAGEQGQFEFQTVQAGTLADRCTLGAGLVMAGATGGDPGTGFINAQGYEINGVALSSSLSIAVLQDQKADATAGGGSTADTWTTRDLNTEVNDPDGIVTISSNQFTPNAGKYLVFWNSAFDGLHNTYRTRVRNITDSTTPAFGMNKFHGAVSGNVVATDYSGFGYIDTPGSKAFAIQYYVDTAVATQGLGRASSETAIEVYTEVLLVKIG